MSISDDLQEASKIAVNDCTALNPFESALVITDEPLRKIGYALWKQASEVSEDAILVEIVPRENHGEEPPKPVANLMKDVDVVLCPTSKSLSHTDARRSACREGVRIATLPDITEDIMARTLKADYHRIAQLSKLLAKKITDATEARLLSGNGKELMLPIGERNGHPDTGLVHNAGEFSNLPAGEAYTAPLEGESHGEFIVNGSMSGVGKLKDEQIHIIVEDGYATEVDGGAPAEKLRTLLDRYDREAYNVAELGIGTNYKAKLSGSPLEDEKVYGTVHVALGDNSSMGGNVEVESHLDGIIVKPTLYLDDELIIDEGEMKVQG